MVTLYSTENCPMCNMLKKRLDAIGVPYEVCTDVDSMESLGIDHVPQLYADGQMMNLPSAMKYINSIESGEQNANCK